MSLSTKETNLPFSIMARSLSTVCYCTDKIASVNWSQQSDILTKIKAVFKMWRSNVAWLLFLCEYLAWTALSSRKCGLLGAAAGTFALKPICAYQVWRAGLFVGAVRWKSRYSEHSLHLRWVEDLLTLPSVLSLPSFWLRVLGHLLIFLQVHPGDLYPPWVRAFLLQSCKTK